MKYYLHSLTGHCHVIGPFDSHDLAIAYEAITTHIPVGRIRRGVVASYNDQEIAWLLSDTYTHSRPHPGLLRKAQTYLATCHPTGLLAGLSK